MRVTGSCHCGAVTYEADIDPAGVGICHCTDCQKLTGSAYRVSVAAARDAFKLLGGAPAVYVKTADSGAKRAQRFCQTCGSPLYTYDVEKPETYGLRVGCIDQCDELEPRRQIWCRSALPWAMNIETLPRLERE